MRTHRRLLLSFVVVATALCLASHNAQAQGKSKGTAHKAPPGHAQKRVVTVDRAIVVTREVLGKHGYDVVRIENANGARVVYYRRGNMGRGKGKGPILKMIVRPAPDRVVFEAVPRTLLVDINVRLGL